MEWIKKSVVGSAVYSFIIKALEIIGLDWVEKNLEYNLIIAIFILIIIIAIVKYFSYIRNFFVRFVWKIIGISDFMNFLEKLKQKKGSTDFDSGIENDIEAYLFTKIYGRHYADVKKKKE